MCGIIVFYCWITNIHTLDDLQQLPGTVFRAVQIRSWDSPLLDSLLGVSKVQNQNVSWATFCFGTWSPLPSTCGCGRIKLLADFIKKTLSYQFTLKCFANGYVFETNFCILLLPISLISLMKSTFFNLFIHDKYIYGNLMICKVRDTVGCLKVCGNGGERG